MSRILRRPMFRGGPVDSRGSGITSGLMDGGRVGYEPGGIVTLQDILSQTGAPMTGQQILDYAANKQMDLGPDFKIFIEFQNTINYFIYFFFCQFDKKWYCNNFFPY